MLLVPIPWAGRVWALPFLTALAPSERYDQEHGRRHKTLADWARQLLRVVRRWWPDRPLIAVADSSYAALELLAACQAWPQPVTVITRLRLDAALYAPAPPRRPRQVGRPRLKGPRLPTLAAVAGDPTTAWAPLTVPDWYGTGPRGASRSSRIRPSGTTPAGRRCRSAGSSSATRTATSPPRPCSAPTATSPQSKSWPGSSAGGSWRSPSRKRAGTSASRPSGSGPSWRSTAPPRRCSACSRWSLCSPSVRAP